MEHLHIHVIDRVFNRTVGVAGVDVEQHRSVTLAEKRCVRNHGDSLLVYVPNQTTVAGIEKRSASDSIATRIVRRSSSALASS